MVESGPEALGHEPLADPGDGRGTDLERLDHVSVGSPRPAGSLISQEQDVRMGQLACGGLADGDQVFQRLSLLNRQGHLELLLTVTDFGGLDVGIPQAMRRSIDFAANSHGIGVG